MHLADSVSKFEQIATTNSLQPASNTMRCQKPDKMLKNYKKTLAVLIIAAFSGNISLMADTPSLVSRSDSNITHKAENTGDNVESYDYEYLDIPVLCTAIWYGSLMSYDDRTLQGFQTILGTKALGADGLPQNESTVYSFLTFQKAYVDDHEPMPAVGTYTMAPGPGDMVIESSAMIYQRDGNGNYEWERKVTDGHLTISTSEADGNTYYHYDLVLTDELGYTHHVTYKSRFVEYADYSQDFNSNRLTKNLNVKTRSHFTNYQGLNDAGDVMKIKMTLSDMPYDETGKHFDPTDLPATEFYVVLYMPVQLGDIVNGTYTVTEEYGDAFTMQPGEIISFAGIEYAAGSYAQYLDAGQGIHWGVFESGEFTISGEGDERIITASFVTEEQYTVDFTYIGKIEVSNVPDSHLTSDITLDLEGAQAVFEYYGDNYSYGGASTWFINISPQGDKKDGFQTELSTATTHSSQGIPTGSFRISPSTSLWPGEYAKGRKGESLLTGTWYLSDFDDDGLPHTYAPATGGDFNITNHGDGTYTFDFAFQDGVNHTWRGTWTGAPLIDVKVPEAGIASVGYGDIEIRVDGLELILSADADVTVVNVAGAEVFNGHASKVALPAAGIYLAKINGNVTKIIAR